MLVMAQGYAFPVRRIMGQQYFKGIIGDILAGFVQIAVFAKAALPAVLAHAKVASA